jgi:hypothetical protein
MEYALYTFAWCVNPSIYISLLFRKLTCHLQSSFLLLTVCLTGVRVTRSLALYVCFVDRCLSFCTFSFDHCVVCSSLIYGFWLPLWHLQTLFSLPSNKRLILSNSIINFFLEIAQIGCTNSTTSEISINHWIVRKPNNISRW